MARLGPIHVHLLELDLSAARAVILALFVLISQMTLVGAADVCTYKRPVVKVVQGQILIYATNEPSSDATVTLTKDGPNGEVVAKLVTNAKGMFRFHEVPVGNYYLLAEASGLRSFGTEVRVSSFPSASRSIIIGLSLGAGGCTASLDVKDLPASRFR